MGWLGINKDITSWELYKDAGAFRVFMHLLLTCNYSYAQWDDTDIDRGEIITSLSHLCGDLGISKNTLLKALSTLENAGEIIRKTDKRRTHIRIVNYDYWTHMRVGESENQKNNGSKYEPSHNEPVQNMNSNGSKNEHDGFKKCTDTVQNMNRCGSNFEHNITNKTNKTRKEQNNTLKRPCESEMSDFLKSRGLGHVSRDTYDACDSYGFEKIGNWKSFCLSVAKNKAAEIAVKEAPKDKPKPKATVTQKEKDEFIHLMEGLGS